MKNKKYLLFDLDGTVTNPKVGITKSVAYALKHFGIIVDDLDQLCKFIGPPLKHSFQEFYGFGEKEADLAVEKYREYFGAEGLFENEVYQGMEDLLQYLVNRGKILLLATSKPAVYAKQILEHFGLAGYFSFVSGSELDGTRVRKSEVIEYALQQNNIIDKSLVVMIGDREHDIIGAKEAGVTSIGVLYGFGDREELEAAGADEIAETVGDVKKLL